MLLLVRQEALMFEWLMLKWPWVLTALSLEGNQTHHVLVLSHDLLVVTNVMFRVG